MVNAVIVGAGQAGLSMSRELNARGVDHVVLERGEVANSWRRQRWDSLRLITPNWMNGLPGHPYAGPEQNGYMSARELVDAFDRFVAAEDLQIETGVDVLAVRPGGGGYLVETSHGMIASDAVVLATGPAVTAKRPLFAASLPRDLVQLSALDYKRACDLPRGRVLVVGASASGVQIAQEIQRSGRDVILAVGHHTRGPRHYRGADIDAWLHLLGLLDVTIDEVDDVARVRRAPSMQLQGHDRVEALDLNALQDIGVEIVGRLAGVCDGRAQFAGSLANMCASADLKMNRLLAAIDAWVETHDLTALVAPAYALPATRVPATPRLSLDFAAERVRTVLWATGVRPDHSFVDLPVFDRKGEIRHDGGVVAPGLFVMGLPFLRRRKSHLIDGAGPDARDLADILRGELDRRQAA
ncbi:NAD(P)-binding domain-containing protein [Acuticoccus sediminis]|uniref:NAD(P)-binding domain-containing protein n=1 Tax=Acuticoccus sediminis TaxID=2184697 RepID=UPI001CFD10FE|nr:NAD(P)-binding domain-containing protein [Acuticoccus sediminis]